MGVLDELRQYVEQADVAALPAIVGKLSEAEALARLRMMAPPPRAVTPPAAEPTNWIKAKAAAAIARVSVDRIYVWAQGQRWASRPTSRTLRIEEGAFRRWLAHQ